MEAGCLHCKNQGHMRHDAMFWRLRPLVCWSRTVTRGYPPPRPEAASPWHRLHLKFAAHCDQQMGLWWPLGVANAINAIMVQADEHHFPKNYHVMPVMPREENGTWLRVKRQVPRPLQVPFPSLPDVASQGVLRTCRFSLEDENEPFEMIFKRWKDIDTWSKPSLEQSPAIVSAQYLESKPPMQYLLLWHIIVSHISRIHHVSKAMS